MAACMWKEVIVRSIRCSWEARLLNQHSGPMAVQRTGLTWRRTENGIAHVVDFQFSRFGDPGSATFTINLGAAFEDVWQVYYGHGFGATINEADCFSLQSRGCSRWVSWQCARSLVDCDWGTRKPSHNLIRVIRVIRGLSQIRQRHDAVWATSVSAGFRTNP